MSTTIESDNNNTMFKTLYFGPNDNQHKFVIFGANSTRLLVKNERFAYIVCLCANIAKIIDVKFAQYVMTHLLNRVLLFDADRQEELGDLMEAINDIMDYDYTGIIFHVVLDRKFNVYGFRDLSMPKAVSIVDESNDLFERTDISDHEKCKLFKGLISLKICDHKNSRNFMYTNIVAEEDWKMSCINEYLEARKESIQKEIEWHHNWHTIIADKIGMPAEDVNTDIILRYLDIDPESICTEGRTEDRNEDRNEDQFDHDIGNTYKQILTEHAAITSESEYNDWELRWTSVLLDLAESPDEALAIMYELNL